MSHVSSHRRMCWRRGKAFIYSLVINPDVSITARIGAGKLVPEAKEGLPAARGTANTHPLYVCAQCRLPLPLAVPMPFLLFLKTFLGSREFLAHCEVFREAGAHAETLLLARGMRAPAKYKNKSSLETMS